MATIKTIRGLIGALKRVLDVDFENLKDYDKLSDDEKQTLSFIRGEVYNSIGDLEGARQGVLEQNKK